MLNVHLLLCDPALLRPGRPSAIDMAQAIGEQVHAAPADWLSPGIADHDHDFLLEDEGDRRLAVMAHTLVTDYGTQAEPCLILSCVMTSRCAAAIPMLTTLTGELDRLGALPRFTVHAVSLRHYEDPIPRLLDLVSEMRGCNLKAEMADSPVAYPETSSALEGVLRRNLLSRELSMEMISVAAERGLHAAGAERLANSVEPWLRSWAQQGITIGYPVPTAHRRGLAETLLHLILANGLDRPSLVEEF